MKKQVLLSLFFLVFGLSAVKAQNEKPSPTPLVRPRVYSVVTTSTPTPTPTPKPTPVTTPSPLVVGNAPPFGQIKPSPTPVATITPKPSPSPTVSPSPLPVVTPTPFNNPANRRLMTIAQYRSKLAEAKRLLTTTPLTIAYQEGEVLTDYVRLAVQDAKTQQIHFITLSKQIFLTRNMQFPVISSLNKQLQIRIIRANGVNTAVMVFDEFGQQYTPLVVQYPIERNGAFAEMAFYTSAHPALISPEMVNVGKLYIRTTIDSAVNRLKNKGVFISPQIADVAERLCIVEHVDHQRFWTESHSALYDEIYTLFSLNEGQTYRFAVSSAGAGGLVQMIPSTYYMVRQRHPNVGLIPDFVEGMRNHPNAAEAMLLYIQDTWNDLLVSETIQNALSNGTATQTELLSAGYNSNPAKLAGYIRRGGNNWRSLIPRETRIYLQIYSSMERFVPLTPRK
jgi:hypothetical protein